MSRIHHAATGAAGGVAAEPTALRDIKADWNRWSWAERIGAIAIFATATIVYGVTMVETLVG
jgi:hypothetical protein